MIIFRNLISSLDCTYETEDGKLFWAMDLELECWTYDFKSLDILKMKQTIYGIISTLLLFPFIIYLFKASELQDNKFLEFFQDIDFLDIRFTERSVNIFFYFP
jgi:hypothetical protein